MGADSEAGIEPEDPGFCGWHEVSGCGHDLRKDVVKGSTTGKKERRVEGEGKR